MRYLLCLLCLSIVGNIAMAGTEADYQREIDEYNSRQLKYNQTMQELDRQIEQQNAAAGYTQAAAGYAVSPKDKREHSTYIQLRYIRGEFFAMVNENSRTLSPAFKGDNAAEQAEAWRQQYIETGKITGQ